MAIQLGKDARISAGEESTAGTEVSRTAVARLVSTTLQRTVEKDVVPHLVGSGASAANPVDFFETVGTVGGDLEINAAYQGGALGLWQYRSFSFQPGGATAVQALVSALEARGVECDVAGSDEEMLSLVQSDGTLPHDIIIMDEPTSAITEREVERLHNIIRQLREAGTTVIYITHKMDEVFAISDEITVFRDGAWVASEKAANMNREKLIGLMVGRELNQLFPKVDAKVGDVILEVENLSRGNVVKNVSFSVRRGEILGFAGLMGSGRSEVLETLFGIFPADSGVIKINGKSVKIGEPHQAIDAGIGLLTEDRKKTGIMGVLSVRENMSIASLTKYSIGGVLRKRKIDEVCEAQRRALDLKTPSLNQLIENLSGGNQQKVLISRWLLTDPDILIIDEPTRGIDVGAKAEIHRLMGELAKQGKAIIMVSSEMPEILGMSDRIVVMCDGSLVGEINSADATQETIMELATRFSVEVVA
jgi:inositol transport system ATP-binding protein